MNISLRLSGEEARSARDTVFHIHGALRATLGMKDHLSLFYGVISRKDLTMRYLSLGSGMAFLAPAGRAEFKALPIQGKAMGSTTQVRQIEENEIRLEPDDRFVLVSDGFVEGAGGEQAMITLLNDHRSKDSKDTLNEMTFRVKSRLESKDDLPAQDCTAVIMDVQPRVMRLARKG
jgi:serine phosphatase RsbU (regulator of sigma subunit)